MSSSATNAVPGTDPVSIGEQKDAIETSNGALPEAENQAMQAAMKIQQMYAEEREKRLRPEGPDQYIDLSINLDSKYQHFREDIFLNERSEKETLKDGERCKFLIMGGGFGGVMFGCHLVKDAGIPASDIKLVEVAGGFGGTWYWNRYPGLMCDVESYIYLPMLEETGFMPKHKYSYGSEIREYVNLLAEKYGIAENAMFRTKVTSLDWDDEHKEWIVKMTKQRKDEASLDLSVRSQFVMVAGGLLLHLKLPNIPGIETFKGHSFHTSRWDYSYTGGSPEHPELVNLKDKRVGIIGTGATAIQAVPHLAKWAKELIVFQRTPSQVDIRGQRETDPAWFKNMQSKKGWQKNRMDNFNGHLSGGRPEDESNDVDDEWTKMRAYRALIGTPGILPMEKIPEYVANLHARDMPRAERVRARVDEIVKDKSAAQDLKSWFPSWCKRPCFHDDYLQCFNQPNVKLVHTDGKGIESLTENGPVLAGKEYPLDCLIWSTGFRAPATGSPASAAGIEVTGRNGRSMHEKWTDLDKMGTFHGVMTRDFPNLFWPGPWQGAASANFAAVLDVLTNHVAHIISNAEREAAKKPGKRYSIEPTQAAEDAWGMQVAMRAGAFAGTSGCTPSYLNREGQIDRLPMEIKMKIAKQSIWGEGILSFEAVLEKWRQEGTMEGVEIQA